MKLNDGRTISLSPVTPSRNLMVEFEFCFDPATLLLMSVVAVFLFGQKKLPELGEALAEGIRNFKDALKSD